MFMPSLAHKFAILGVEVLTMLFWFAGFIALAVYITATIFDYCTGGFCSGLKAACVFAAFEWYVIIFPRIREFSLDLRSHRG